MPPKADSAVEQLHTIVVGQPLHQNVEGHTARTDSPEFKRARATLHKIIQTFDPNPYGTGAVQAHHGGSIWVHTSEADHPWRLVLNWAGIEWSSQFCCNPTKVEQLRQNAAAILDAFPDTVTQLEAFGYTDTDILTTPVTDAATVGRYVDSIWNSCVPIPQPHHTGSVKTGHLLDAGVHTYPEPACAIERVMYDDFVPYIVDPKTHTTATVVPVAPRGSGDGRVRIVATEPGSPYRRSPTTSPC